VVFVVEDAHVRRRDMIRLVGEKYHFNTRIKSHRTISLEKL